MHMIRSTQVQNTKDYLICFFPPSFPFLFLKYKHIYDYRLCHGECPITAVIVDHAMSYGGNRKIHVGLIWTVPTCSPLFELVWCRIFVRPYWDGEHFPLGLDTGITVLIFCLCFVIHPLYISVCGIIIWRATESHVHIAPLITNVCTVLQFHKSPQGCAQEIVLPLQVQGYRWELDFFKVISRRDC